jgi:hypothetical protein
MMCSALCFSENHKGCVSCPLPPFLLRHQFIPSRVPVMGIGVWRGLKNEKHRAACVVLLDFLKG